MNLIALALGVVPGGSSAGSIGLNQGTRSANQASRSSFVNSISPINKGGRKGAVGGKTTNRH